MRLQKLHNLYIKGTQPQAIITIVEVHLCQFTLAVTRVIEENDHASEKCKLFVSTRVLKHLYDKKPAEEYDFVLANAHTIAKYPDHIYKNKNAKRGDFILRKNVSNEDWLCSVERVDGKCNLVTCFRLRKENYLNSYNLIWSWKDDIPSS